MSFNICIVTLDGSPWFVAADVCRALGLPMDKGTTMHLAKLSHDEKCQAPQLDLGATGRGGLRSNVPVNLVSESGLYKLILRSDKPQAHAFQDWVTRVVLPTIRATGSYVVGEERLSDPAAPRDELEAISEAVEGLLKGAFENRKKLSDPSSSGAEASFPPWPPGRPIGGPWPVASPEGARLLLGRAAASAGRAG